LIAPVAEEAGRVTHTGKPETFDRKLREASECVLKGMGNAARIIEKLGRLPFDSRKLVRHRDLKDLFSVTGEDHLRAACEQRVPKEAFNDIADAKERKRLRNAALIEQIPRAIGNHEALRVFDSTWRNNASMWDFINAFTAYARTQPLAKRLKTEARAGELADWIAKNSRKFARGPRERRRKEIRRRAGRQGYARYSPPPLPAGGSETSAAATVDGQQGQFKTLTDRLPVQDRAPAPPKPPNAVHRR